MRDQPKTILFGFDQKMFNFLKTLREDLQSAIFDGAKNQRTQKFSY